MIAVGITDDGRVAVVMGKDDAREPAATLYLSPRAARAMADDLIRHAHEAEQQAESVAPEPPR